MLSPYCKLQHLADVSNKVSECLYFKWNQSKCAWNHRFLLDDAIWCTVPAHGFLTAPECWMKHKPAVWSRKCGWQCFGRNTCGWAPWRVAASVHLSVFLLSYPSTEGLQRSQWVGVKSKEVRKTTTGSASAQGLSTATASCIRLIFPKQNTEPPNSSLPFPPMASHIFPYSKTKWLDWSWVFSTMFCCLPHDTVFVLLT